MKAVILAGGKGTRLGSLTSLLPKPMVKIGNIPVLEHQINLLKRYGIKDIIILTGYLSEVIEIYFKTGKSFGVNIKYFKEKEPLGTTGGIKAIESSLSDDFLVLYGDIIIDMDLSRLMNFHKNKKGIATVVLHSNTHPYDSDLVDVNESQQITAFHPKPHDNAFYRNLVNAGVYILSPKIFQHLEKNKSADFARDIFPALIKKENLFGYNTPEYIKDMGTPERLKEVEEDYASGKIARLNLQNKRNAVFLDRDGVINEKVDQLHNIEDFRLIDVASEAIKKLNSSEYLSIIITNQPAVARNLCTIQDIENIHNKMETLLGNNAAKMDAIYFCPHHPDRGFPDENLKYKINCSCRKPKTGMIEKAVSDFNINLDGSYLVGDSSRDIECGKNAGITTIGVRTGDACKDCQNSPDFMFDNILEATKFIISKNYKKYFEKINALYFSKKPFVIGIAGNTRSGKSTFSKYLELQFKKMNKNVLLVTLDNWLLPVQERNHGMNVYERFQLSKISTDLKRLFEKNKLEIPRYNPFTRTSSDLRVIYNIADKDIVIVEGIVGLADELKNLYDFRVYCDIPFNVLKERFRKFYNWKGLSVSEIQKLFESRLEDEYKLIMKDSVNADLVIGD